MQKELLDIMAELNLEMITPIEAVNKVSFLIKDLIGENEDCPCSEKTCPIRRINQFREDCIHKLYE